MSTAIRIELEQGSKAWHAWRLTGLGGSDAPVVDGTCPYRTMRQLVLVKQEKIKDDDDSSKEFIFAKGHQTEKLVRAQLQERLGTDFEKVCLQNREFPHLIASLDGLNSQYGVLEAKLVGKEVLEIAKTKGEIPAHHNTQMQHQFAVSGADVGQWFGHDGKKNGLVITIRRDEKFIKKLLDKEHRVWADIKAGKVPELSDRDYLYPEDTTLLAALRDAKELSENAAIEFKDLKERAIVQYGHTRIAGAGVKLFQVIRKGGEVDFMSIPEVAAAAEEASRKHREAAEKAAQKAAKKVYMSLDLEYIDKFKAKDSISWTLRIDAPKKEKVTS